MPTPPDSSYREIPLSHGQVALIDAEDYERLSQHKWRAWTPDEGRTFYAVRNQKGDDGQWRVVHMHREILGLDFGDKRTGDHRFHRTLDNRKFIDGEPNLRIADKCGNSRNRRGWGKGGVKGIYWVERLKKYRIVIYAEGKRRHLGCRSTLEEAKALHREAALHFHGEFANFDCIPLAFTRAHQQEQNAVIKSRRNGR